MPNQISTAWLETNTDQESYQNSLEDQLEVFRRVLNKPENWPSAHVMRKIGCDEAAVLLERADACIEEAYKAFSEFYNKTKKE